MPAWQKVSPFDTEVSNGSSGATPTINWVLGANQAITLNANATFTFTPTIAGTKLLLRITQDSTGSRTAIWPGTVKWIGSAAPTLSTAPGAIDIVTFYWNGTNYYGVLSGNFG